MRFIVREQPVIRNTTIGCMRNNYKDQWVTADTVRNSCDRGGGYTRKVLENAAEVGIIEKKTELKPVSLYRIDPREGVIACPIEPEKPYNETICGKLEKTLEDCSPHGYRECKPAILTVINQTIQESLEAEDYDRVRRLTDFAQSVLKPPEREGVVRTCPIPR